MTKFSFDFIQRTDRDTYKWARDKPIETRSQEQRMAFDWGEKIRIVSAIW
jgi:hypothetical protein